VSADRGAPPPDGEDRGAPPPEDEDRGASGDEAGTPDDGILDLEHTHAQADLAWDGFVGRLEAEEQLRLGSEERFADARDALRPGATPPDAGLVARLKAAWTTRPLHALEQRKGQRGWDAYPVFELALLAIDTVVERMELGSGITPEELRDLLAEAAALRAPDAGQRSRFELADGIIDALLQEFPTDYGAADDEGGYVVRRWRPRLLLEIEGDEGIQLRATPIAVNVLVSALDVDEIESSQAATHAALESLIRRGKLTAARKRADEARKLSKLYAEQIRQLVAASRRSVRSVNWAEQVRPGLTNAYAHLSERAEAESALAHRLEEQEDDPERPLDGQRAADVAAVLDTVRGCLARHRELHVAVMDAQRALLEHQAQQAFRPPPTLARVDLDREVLDPLLDRPAGEATAIVERSWSAFAGARAPRFPGLDVMLRRLLQPLQERAPATGATIDDDAPLLEDLAARFGRERIARVDAAIVAQLDADGRAQLSAVLAVLDDREDRRLAGLLALSAYDPAVGESAYVAGAGDGRLVGEDIAGDDLLLVALNEVGA
jgi:hypothetical protein